MQQAILDDWFLRQDILDKLMGQDEEQAEAERYADRIIRIAQEDSAEHQVLPFSGHQGKNPVNVLAEPHVKHAVGFVKDKMFHLTQVEMALLVQVKQPSGRCDQNVHPASEGFDLRRLPHTAEDHGGMERELTSVHAKTVANLGSEFSGGRENQGSNRSSGGGFSSCEVVTNGEGKGSRFPRPGLGDAEDVPTAHERRNGFGLNRCGRAIAFAFEGL